MIGKIRLVSCDAVKVIHYDPIVHRELTLLVAAVINGYELDVPEILDVIAFRLHAWEGFPAFRASHEDRTLTPATSNALTREFSARVKSDPTLRKWLIAEVTKTRFGLSD